MGRFFLSILIIALTLGLQAQTNQLKSAKTPKLVVGITIDHLRSDYVTRYWDTFQEGGFKRLFENGAYSLNARLDIHNIRTSTVIPTIYTGSYPAEHGIVGDKWYKHLTKKEIDAINDDFYLTLGSDSKNGNMSANMLKMYTLGDAMKEISNFRSKVYSVALNPVAAVLSAGHAADGAFWLDPLNGKMISSSYYMENFPDWVMNFNERHLADYYLEQKWEPLLPPSSYKTDFEDAYILEKGFWKKWNTFPYDLSKLTEMVKSKYQLLAATPYGNKFVKEFAFYLIDQQVLGNDADIDLLNLTFTSMDFANKWFTPSSVETHDMYLRLDQDITSLLNYLDRKIGKENYMVFLTAASTGGYPPDVLKEEMNLPCSDFSPHSAMALLRAYLNAVYGVGEWILMYNEEQVFLNHELIEEKEIKLDDMQQKTALFLNQFEGIKAAVPASLIELSNFDNRRFQIIENSYCIQRSGDVMLILEEGWYPVPRYNEVEYSAENRFPVVFYGANIKPGILDTPIEAIDILPTLCNYLNILPPDGAKGKVVKSVFWYN
ncbi:MAG: alkaline phosphatase family protein [Bacteroidales bacterium]|nr:alkaline phosphatase family protein [Bacteroidales bacterium]